jgi:hypothetical protein
VNFCDVFKFVIVLFVEFLMCGNFLIGNFCVDFLNAKNSTFIIFNEGNKFLCGNFSRREINFCVEIF